MLLIKGITVTLTQKTPSGVDPFGVSVYTETEVDVENVLVSPSSDTEILDTLNLTGKRAAYTLCIPKGDTHDWTNTTVRFFGETWRTIGHGQLWIEENVPLAWNRKVMVESIVSGES